MKLIDLEAINVKDSKGKIVKTLQSNINKSAGKYSLVWDAAKNANGAYTFEIIASDEAKNRSSAPHKFTLNNVFKGKITVNNVFIRQKTSSSSKALGMLNKNNEVVVLQKTGSWYYIQSGKTKGYITSIQITNNQNWSNQEKSPFWASKKYGLSVISGSFIWNRISIIY